MAQTTHITDNTTKQIYRVLLLCLVSLFSLPTQADFVTDKIVIEVRSQPLSQGTVLKTLPSGSVVEVLMTDGNYARILTNDNITGWVQSQFLTTEQPAQIEYLKLLAKSRTLEAKLKAAESGLGEDGGDGIDIAEIEELRKRAAEAGWMRVELKKARERNNEIETKLKSGGQTTNNSKEELKTLRGQNKALQERLATAMLAANEQQEMTTLEDGTTSMHNPQNNDKSGMEVNIEWFLGSIVVALIIGLITGIKWLDNRIRQRHGGFRLY